MRNFYVNQDLEKEVFQSLTQTHCQILLSATQYGGTDGRTAHSGLSQ